MRLPPRRAAAVVWIAVVLGGAGACGAGRDPEPAAPAAPVETAQRSGAVVWAVGDGSDNGSAARAMAARIAASRPSRVLYLGDVYADGTADAFRTFGSVYGALARRMDPTPGNHDWPNRRQGYDRYWQRVRGRPMPAYYARRVGGWQLLSLNSEAPHSAGSPQLRWIARQVRSGGTCRIAFWHRPRFSAARHGDQPDTQTLWAAVRGHAVIVASGHDHDMQRFRPRDGMTQFVSGAGGHGHYPVRSRGDLAFANGSEYGALRLELRPGKARYAFVTVSGNVLDSGTIPCRRR